MKSKVLLIDDSVTIHRVIDLSIDMDRYDIVKVFSKEDAALKMQSEQFDYILLDNKLDNIVISDYIKELKAVQPSASIILLVGAFDRFDESDLEKTGADDYLVKPFDSQSLNEKLSSDADMMPAGIVERIAEADFARDNDDYITPTASLTTGEVIDGLSKKEYLENLEEVQPDDLTDNGYVEDLDTATSLEFDKLPQETDKTLEQNQEENIEKEQNNIINDAEESSIIEESPEEDIIVAEDSEDEIGSITVNDTVSDAVSNEDTEINGTSFESETEQAAENEEVINIPVEEDNSAAEELSASEPAEETTADNTADIETVSAEDIHEEENAQADTEEIEIPDNITAVHNPVLPDIDDAADISDEYVMQDNIEKADNISQNDMLDEFPDFPDVDDISTDEMQDSQETADNQIQETDNTDNIVITEETAAELPADNTADEEVNETSEEQEVEAVNLEEMPADNTEEQENLLVDDDDWLSDAPAAQEETTADVKAEEPQLDLSEETTADTENEDMEKESIPAADNDIQAESAAEETQEQEEKASEIQEQAELDYKAAEEIEDSIDISYEEPVQLEENHDNTQEDKAVEKAEDTANNGSAADELPEMPSLDEVSAMAESIDTADEQPAEENIEPVTAENEGMEEDSLPVEDITDNNLQEETEPLEEQLEETAAEEVPFDMPQEVKAEDAAAETAFPVQQEDNSKQVAANINQAEVKQAEEYSPETSGRFGGITVTISRDEIIAMLGNAIDKHFLEEAVKEVIASNMKEIVRNIVPAIAEKYIKEEIERLKNDE